MNKYARRWGYDHDTSEFKLLIDNSAIVAIAVVTLKSESGQEARKEIVTKPGSEHRIPFFGIKENEWIQGQLLVSGRVVDEFGVRTETVTCPHCGKRIDKAE